MDNGFIKLHRKLIEWEWFADSKTFHVFMFLLLDANHTNQKWRGITVERGQILTGRIKISEATGISQQSVRTALANLSLTKEITIEPTNRFSIITICNYNKYQDAKTINNQPTNQQLTNDQPTANQQLTTNKKVKNEKKEPLDKYAIASEAIKADLLELFPRIEKDYDFELAKWRTYREGKKPVLDLKANLMDWMKRAAGKIKTDGNGDDLKTIDPERLARIKKEEKELGLSS